MILPNFLPATIPIAFAIFMQEKYRSGDELLAGMMIALIGIHALTGLADIMANHFNEN